MLITSKDIRWLVRRDLKDIVEIEQMSYSDPWSKQDFEEQLKEKNCIGLVAMLEDDIVGYALYLLQKTNIQIINMVIHPKYRRLKIGTTMLKKLKNKLGRKKNCLYVDIDEHNLVAQLFLKHSGFLATGIHKNTNSSDSYRMEFFEHIT